MINLEAERIIPLVEVPKLKFIPLRRRGARLHICTVWRWAEKGVGGNRLDTLRIGGQRVTSIEAVQRFITATSAAAKDPGAATSRPAGSPSHQHADRQLKDAGW